jgi:hypothetical protein
MLLSQISFGCNPAWLMSSLSQKQRHLRAYPSATSATPVCIRSSFGIE